MNTELKFYSNLLNEIKNRVRQGQLRANVSANAEMLATYWDIGKMIHERQKLEGWGKGVIPRLANDLKNELSDIKGFSERNIQFMIQFYCEYAEFGLNTKRPVSQIEEKKQSPETFSFNELQNTYNQQSLILLVGWAHHIILIQKVKDLTTRYWYMQQTVINGWSRDTLADMIKSNIHQRQGNAATNFELTLPPLQSALAKQMLKDPCISGYELTRILPDNYKSSLPTVEEIEAELNKSK